PDPFGRSRGARLYQTGDRARWSAEGHLEFLGRRDDQVKIHGYRVELGEVELALRGLPQIAEAVVVVQQTLPGDKRLVGYVVGRGSEPWSVEDVRTGLRAKLPEYMVPAYVVMLDQMPLTPNGKIDRRALPAAEPTRASYEAVRTPAEITLAGIWQQVLG